MFAANPHFKDQKPYIQLVAVHEASVELKFSEVYFPKEANG